MMAFRSTSIVPKTAKNAIRFVLAILLTCVVLSVPGTAYSQPKSDESDSLEPFAPSIITKDGLRLSAMYYPSALKKKAGVVVLVHDLSGNQLDWGKLPLKLQEEGHAVVVFDMRGHGQSTGKPMGIGNDTVEAKAKPKTNTKTKPTKPTKPTKTGIEARELKPKDFPFLVEFDMKAVKQFIYEEHQKEHLNMNKMAIIGAGLGATVALKFAEMDWAEPPHEDGPEGNKTPRGQDVRALVLLTPDADVPVMPLPDTIKSLRDPSLYVAIMFAVGKNDKKDKGQTKKLYDQAITPVTNRDRMYFQEYNSAASGTGLLLAKNLPVEQNIVTFLEKHLTKFESEWRDRQSRIGRPKTGK